MSVASLLPRFQRAHLAMRALAEHENLSRDELQAMQLQRLNDLWTHARAHVPHYRDLHQSKSLPARFASLAEFESLVPVLEKPMIAANPRSFLSSTAGRGSWHSTSGSTGTPMRVFRTHGEHREMLCAKYRFYQSWGVEMFDRMAWLWNVRDGGKSPIVQRCQDRLRNRLRLPAADLSDDALEKYLRRIERFRPSAIYGLSRALHLLAIKAQSAGFCCDSLKFVCLTGETASDAMMRTVENALGAPAIMEYGSVDCGFLAGTSPDDRTLRVRADMAHLETVARPDGLYDILVTVLCNRSFPLLRYRIGDVTDSPIDAPRRGMPILQSIAGRDDDCLIARGGRIVHATSIDELFENDSSVRGYRVHQNAGGAVDVMLTLNDARFDRAALARELADRVDGFTVNIKVVDRLPQTQAGKHRLVTSDIAISTRENHAEQLQFVKT